MPPANPPPAQAGAAGDASSLIPLKTVTFALPASAVRQPACVVVTPANPQSGPAHAMAKIVRRVVPLVVVDIGYLWLMGRSATSPSLRERLRDRVTLKRRSLAKRPVLCLYRSIRLISQYEKLVMMMKNYSEANRGAR
jgi:hypothetical protein